MTKDQPGDLDSSDSIDLINDQLLLNELELREKYYVETGNQATGNIGRNLDNKALEETIEKPIDANEVKLIEEAEPVLKNFRGKELP